MAKRGDPVLVRCKCGRYVAAARDSTYFTKIEINHWVRKGLSILHVDDVSFSAALRKPMGCVCSVSTARTHPNNG